MATLEPPVRSGLVQIIRHKVCKMMQAAVVFELPRVWLMYVFLWMVAMTGSYMLGCITVHQTKTVSDVFTPERDIVLFSNFDEDTSNCYLHGEPFQDCRGTTPIRRYNTCAVVGGSGIIKGTGCGPEIDRHDFVIRFNMAPITGYANDVGVKVNMVVVGTFKLHMMKNTLEADPDSLHTLAKWKPEKYMSSREEILSRLKSYNNSIFFYPKPIFDPRSGHGTGPDMHLKTLNDMWKDIGLNITITYNLFNLKDITVQMLEQLYPRFRAPSVGIITYLQALTFCDHVNLYGFYPLPRDPLNRVVPFHYHDDLLPV
ncbi:PREDICTED: CMP-N-acetylneuraminate-poly-alpha-2,8-sialyltransferase-like [Branchiostoma belcheri]|uniref:CMP-N-acetylneuraminate-poly-alpha-2, 8-sialyltransferase-like n=1 Tax=Branchiostoma belcheri TaxID=7741 RepID=A0A6P4YKQ8_BRABE|nr:PREDICTED: CMP-N-acetylneuraminate-poly-alpha-2,8-sialyltransferase-like [Branchiostoma belcheri]